MHQDLFQGEPLTIDAPDADITLHPALDLPCPAGALLEELIDSTPWRQDTLTLFGREVVQPRLVAWYGDPEAHYSYSGLNLAPLPWTPRLIQLRDTVEAASAARYNAVLLNYYRDGSDSMGMHADDEPELGPTPVIASLSLGQTRTLVCRHRQRRHQPRLDIPLHDGSLLVMRGTTQRHWLHGINKTRRPCGPRLNLTFRWILTPST